MRYYDFRRNWTKRVVPHLDDPDVQAVLCRDMSKLTIGEYGEEFLPGDKPCRWETCDWSISRRWSRFFDYVLHGACHYLVNFNLRLAQKVAPGRPWRILSSDQHSTVWDGADTLFDMNYCALQIPPDKAIEYACGPNPENLGIGEERKVGYASPRFKIVKPDNPLRSKMETEWLTNIRALIAAGKLPGITLEYVGGTP